MSRDVREAQGSWVYLSVIDVTNCACWRISVSRKQDNQDICDGTDRR